MGLNPNQQRFVDEYLIDLNATQAAIRAGYEATNADVTGPRLLGNVGVAKAIADAQAERSIRTRITADRVFLELSRIGLADIRGVVKWRANVSEVGREDEDGTPETRTFNEVELIGSEEIDYDAAAAIAEVSQGKDGILKIKMHNKVAALQEMGRHLGIASRHEHSGPNGGPIQTEETSARVILAGKLARLVAPAAAPGDAGEPE